MKFLSEYGSEDFPEEILWSNFEATIAQDGKELGKIDFKGCVKDQPHVFEGYIIPNSDAMAVLISNKGDCFEGGYVKEILSVVKGVRYYNKNIVRSFKTASATETNEGNLVVYAGTNETALPIYENGGSNKKSNNTLYAVIAIILGLGLGCFLGRKKRI